MYGNQSSKPLGTEDRINITLVIKKSVKYKKIIAIQLIL